jgi:hypothetical protein
MATLEGVPDRRADEVCGRLRGFRTEALSLLPDSVVLLGFQALGLFRPAPASLATLPHFALLSSPMWTAESVLLLSILVSRRPSPSISQHTQPLVTAFGWTLTFALGALLFGVRGAIFDAVDITSGSWTLSAAVAGVLMGSRPGSVGESNG